MLQTLNKQQTSQNWSENSQILSVYAGMDSVTWKLGLINSLKNEAFQSAILKLANQALVPNPFYELPFLKPSAKNLGGDQIHYLYLSEQNGDEETLKLFMPVSLGPIGILRRKVLRTWTTPYTPVGMPLVADNTNKETLKAFIECVQIAQHDEAKAIVIDELEKEGPFIEKLYHSKILADKLLLTTGSPRAGLKPVKNLDYVGTYFSGKRKQRQRKAKANLDKLGKVTFQTHLDAKSIHTPLDNFLKLEESSWKGAHNTALNSSPVSVKFCKEAVYNMASHNKCSIHELILNSKTIASLIAFESNGKVFPWKIAFDETYAKYSVGNLLSTHVTSQFASSENFKGLDSLAAEHNDTTLRFWPDEKMFFTMIIGIGNNATQSTMGITDELNRLKRIKVIIRSFLKKHSYLDHLVSSVRM